MAGSQKKKRRRSRHDPNRAHVAQQREESRQRQREERRRAALAAATRQRRAKILKRWGRYALIGGGVTLIALLVFRPDPEVDGVERPREIRATPIAAEATYDYGTGTPTSGPYLPGAPRCGVFEVEISTEAAATAVYRGAVVIWYRPDLDPVDRQALLAAAAGHRSHVVISPQDGLEAPIVATAWNRLKRYEPGEPVEGFIDVYRRRAPGNADCPIEG